MEWKANPPAMVLGVAFSPDGKVLAAATPEGTLVRGVDDGRVLAKLEGAGSKASSVQFTRDGATLLTCPAPVLFDDYVQLSDAKTGRAKQVVTRGRWTLAAISSPDGQSVAYVWDGQFIRISDIATGEDCPRNIGENLVDKMAMSRDGKHLAVERRFGNITLHDAATGQTLRQLANNDHYLVTRSFWGEDLLLMLNGPKTKLPNLSVASGHAREVVLPSDVSKYNIVSSRDTRVLAFPGAEGSVYIWDAVKDRLANRLETEIKHGQCHVALELSPNGSLLVVAVLYQGGHRAELWDTATCKKLRDFAVDKETIGAPTFSHDGYTVADFEYPNVTLWESASGLIRGRLPVGGEGRLTAIEFSPDGRVLALGHGGERQFYRYFEETYAFRYSFLFHKRPAGNVHLLDIQSGAIHTTLGSHLEEVTRLAFSGDGKKLATLGSEGIAYVRNVPQPARRPAVDLSPKQLESLWARLGGDECPAAYAAHWEMVASPGPAVAFLKKHLKPIKHADPLAVARYRAELDDDKFVVRERAMAELKKIGNDAEPILRQLLPLPQPTLEMRMRVELLLKPFDNSLLSLDRLREGRAIEVLERIGTAEARDLLESIAKGAPGMRLTCQAAAAVERLRAFDR
jgi:WD40 repeat protein